MTHRFHTCLRTASCFVAVAVAFVACAPEDEASSVDPNDPIAETTQDVTSAGRRVCSWNMHRLGNMFDQLPKDTKVVAKIIKDNCDVIAVQEVMQIADGAVGYDELLTALGKRYWGGVITAKTAPFPTTSNSEHYAFYFRKSAASLCSGWEGVKQLKDEEDVFIREPAWACFKLKAREQELVIAGYHALFGEIAERKREIGFIDDDLDRDGKKDDVFNALKAARPGDPDVMLIGDFNLKPNELAEVLPRYIDHTVGEGSTINDGDDVTDNLYDHVLLPADSPLVASGTKPATVLDVRRAAPSGKYYKTVSDHLPIRIVVK